MRGGILTYFKKSDFVKNSFTLVTGIGIAQLIPILLQPILRRVFLPEDFGAFAVYMSIIGILSVLFMLRFQMAIVIPEDDKDAANLFFFVMIIDMAFSVLIFLIIVIFKHQFVDLFDFPEKYSYWLYFIPLSTFLFCSVDAMNYWLIRKKAFKASAINKISRRGSEGIVQVLFSLYKKSIGLLIGDLVGNIANTVSGIRQVKRTGLTLSLLDTKRFKPLAKQYISFSKNTIPAVFNSAATLLPVIFINRIFSEDVTGYFDLSRLVLSVPTILISTAISQVLLQKLTEKKNQSHSIRNEVKKVFYILLIVGLLETLVILLFGPEIFTFVFGKESTMSGEYSQILVFSYAFKFIVSPLSIVFIALNKIKTISIWQTVYFLAILLLLIFNDLAINEYLTLYTIIELLSYTFYFVLIINAIKKYELGLKKGI